MKLLHISHRASFQGGLEQILFDSIRGLARMGWQQGLLHTSAVPDLRFTEVTDWVSTDRAEVERFQPDLILVHKFDDVDYLNELASRYPLVMMVHDHDLVCPRRYKYFPISKRVCEHPAGANCLAHLCMVQKSEPGSLLPVKLASLGNHLKRMRAQQNFAGYIVGSEWMKNSLAINGFPESKIAIIPPIPASLSHVRTIPLPSSPSILFVGQLIRGKGVDLFLDALASLKGEWTAEIVGEGNGREALELQAINLGIANRVNFRGWIDHAQLDALYENATFSVVPSRWPEPFGMVGIEAMARGRAVIGFGVGGIPDWLTDGESGFLIAEQDADAMRAAMARLLDNPELNSQLAAGARRSVETRFGHQGYLNKLSGFLESKR